MLRGEAANSVGTGPHFAGSQCSMTAYTEESVL